MVLGLVGVVAGLVVGLNVAVDPYGLYRDTHGRKLPAYGDSRVSKYLLSVHYVPQNFDAVLIGSSASANWEMAGIEKLRVYNDSLDGGNIVEGKALVDQMLSVPGIRVAFLLVHPYLTSAHNMETVAMEPSLKYSGLGSDNLLTAYKEMLKVRLHRGHAFNNPTGTEPFDVLPTKLNPVMEKLLDPATPFQIDPVALTAYRDVVSEFRAHQVQLIFVIPPMLEELILSKQAAFRDYYQLIESSRKPEDLTIDFTSEDFAGFRRNRANFGDGVHMFTKPAGEVVSVINARVNDWIAQGRLHP